MHVSSRGSFASSLHASGLRARHLKSREAHPLTSPCAADCTHARDDEGSCNIIPKTAGKHCWVLLPSFSSTCAWKAQDWRAVDPEAHPISLCPESQPLGGGTGAEARPTVYAQVRPRRRRVCNLRRPVSGLHRTLTEATSPCSAAMDNPQCRATAECPRLPSTNPQITARPYPCVETWMRLSPRPFLTPKGCASVIARSRRDRRVSDEGTPTPKIREIQDPNTNIHTIWSTYCRSFPRISASQQLRTALLV